MAEAFDTLTAAEKLQNGGFSDDQSKAIAHVIGDAITGNVATKSDVENLRVAMKGEIEVLKKEIENGAVKTRFWIVSGLVSTIGAIKALDYLLPLIVP